MATLDDDDEVTVPDIVSDYYFFDSKDEPVSFTELPVQWGYYDRSYDNKNKIYLRGTTYKGLQKVHKQVKAWKCAFLKATPEISVLSKDNNWIRLQKPRKSYEIEIRTILITLHSLHFFKTEPKASSKDLQYHLSKVFSSYEVLPSGSDLIDHLDFVREAVKRDYTLQKSKILASLLEGRKRKGREFDRNDGAIMKPDFIVDDIKSEYEDDDKESDVEDDNNDTVCAICDNGGNLTCCDGKCLRAFHATLESAKSTKSDCKSLCLPADKVKGSEPFICLNCFHEQHQCFVCGELGSSNKASSAEVFRCSLETCGHFYHPQCVSKLLKDGSDSEAHDLEEKIIAGEPFTCPTHKCHKCKQEENEKVKGLQFAVCRRCPKSYHKKCLPSKIMFDCEDYDEVRAWNGLLPKSRALIFCLKHKMDKKLHTAQRNIKFPEIEHSKKEVAVNEEGANSAYTFDERSHKKLSSEKRVRMSSRSEPVKKHSKDNISINIERDSKEHSIPFDEDEQTLTTTPMECEDGKSSLDAASRERILALVKEVESYITMEKLKRHDMGKFPSAQSSSPEVEKSMEGVHLASKRQENGRSMENAVAVCEPCNLDQLRNLKDKLKVYVAPFQDEIRHMEVENSELNCEVPLKTPEKESACVRSQKESSHCDNGETGTKEKVDGHKENHVSYLPHQSQLPKIQHSDFEIRGSNYDGRGYNRYSRSDFFSSQRAGYGSRHCDSRFASRYTLADPATYNWSSISVMQRYATKLDELNHSRMNNRSIGGLY